MGSSLKSQYNEEKYLEIRIILNKLCYVPGEQINGNLIIKGKPILKQTNFNETKMIIKINQMQQYSYRNGRGENSSTYIIKDNSELISENIDYTNYKGSNLMNGINLPFSIKIPYDNIQPSVFLFSYYIKHFIYFEFPGLKSKRSLMIFIKSFNRYNHENGLLKKPAIAFGDFYKMKKRNIRVVN